MIRDAPEKVIESFETMVQKLRIAHLELNSSKYELINLDVKLLQRLPALQFYFNQYNGWVGNPLGYVCAYTFNW